MGNGRFVCCVVHRSGWLQPARCLWLGACAEPSSCKSRLTIGTGTACGVTSPSSLVSRSSSSCCPASWHPPAYKSSTLEALTNTSWAHSVYPFIFNSIWIFEFYRQFLRCTETDKSYRFLKNLRFMRQHQQANLLNKYEHTSIFANSMEFSNEFQFSI